MGGSPLGPSRALIADSRTHARTYSNTRPHSHAYPRTHARTHTHTHTHACTPLQEPAAKAKHKHKKGGAKQPDNGSGAGVESRPPAAVGADPAIKSSKSKSKVPSFTVRMGGAGGLDTGGEEAAGQAPGQTPGQTGAEIDAVQRRRDKEARKESKRKAAAAAAAAATGGGGAVDAGFPGAGQSAAGSVDGGHKVRCFVLAARWRLRHCV